MEQSWGGEVRRTSARELVTQGLPAARTPGEVVASSLREVARESALTELAARESVLLQDVEVQQALGGVARAGQLLLRARVRLACEVAQRGMHLGTGFGLGDWLALRCPDLSAQVVRELARVAQASRDAVHAPLVDAVLSGGMSLERAARLHRALVRIRGSITAQSYPLAVELLVDAGCTPLFEDKDIDRVIEKLLRECLPEKDHQDRERAQRQRRNVYESNLADGSLKRIVLTFGEDADYEAVRAILRSPLAAPASKEEVEATGELDLRSPGQRRYDALMTVLKRGVAGTQGQPTTAKAALIVTLDLQTLKRDLSADGDRLPGCGSTPDGASVTAGSIRRLACEADIIPMVLAGPTEIVDQGRRRRLVTPGQRIRLAARDKGCTIPGCTLPATWCDAHHIVPWARGGRSDLDNYALLCPRHHTWVHEKELTATVTTLGVNWQLL